MTRIPYVNPDRMVPEARMLAAEQGNLNAYRVLANAPRTFTGWMVAGRAALTSRVLSARLRELVILRIAYLMESEYEIVQHTTVAHEAGVTLDEIVALAGGWDRPGVFTGVELVVLQLTTELLSTGFVSPGCLARMHRALGSEATVEVLMVINRWAGLCLMLNALEVDPDPHARLVVPGV